MGLSLGVTYSRLLAIVVPIGLLTGIAVSVVARLTRAPLVPVTASAAVAVSKPVEIVSVKAVERIEPDTEPVEAKDQTILTPPLPTVRPVAPQASGARWEPYRYRYWKRERRKRKW